MANLFCGKNIAETDTQFLICDRVFGHDGDHTRTEHHTATPCYCQPGNSTPEVAVAVREGESLAEYESRASRNSLVELDAREAALEAEYQLSPEMRAGRVLNLTERIEALEAERAAERQALADQLGTGSHECGAYKVIVTLPNRWTREGKAAFQAMYPRDRFAQFYKLPELNTAVIDKMQPAIDTTGFKALGDPTVRIMAA